MKDDDQITGGRLWFRGKRSRTLVPPGDGLRVYVDLRDWWIGYFRSPTHHYVCPLPTLVIRWPRTCT